MSQSKLRRGVSYASCLTLMATAAAESLDVRVVNLGGGSETAR